MNIKKNYLKSFAILLVFSLGFLLRIHSYLVNNSFFLDEILLGFNVIQKNYLQLLYPLNCDQAAPFLFLWSTKFIISKLGISELAFRLIPFLSSIISIFAFYFLTKKFLQKFWTRLLSLILFCINFQLLFYAQAFKQYSSDVLIAILLLLAVVSIDIKKLTYPKALLLGLLASIAFCFSFTALFVIIGITIVALYFSKEFKKIIVFISPIFLTLIGYCYTTLLTVKNTDYLNHYWENGFNVINFEIYKLDYNFLFMYYSHPIFFLFLFILGILWAYKSDKFKSLILMSPILITLTAAAFRIYPFKERLILFLLPIILILIVIPLDKAQFNKKIINILVIIISSVFFLTYFINFSTNFISQKMSYLRQDVKPLLITLKKEKKKNDIVYIYYGASKSYLYYDLLMNLPKENLYIGAMPENENIPSNFIEKDLQSLPKNKAIWFIFVKGNNLYKNDTKRYKNWLYKNRTIEKDIVLKSARLIKINRD